MVAVEKFPSLQPPVTSRTRGWLQKEMSTKHSKEIGNILPSLYIFMHRYPWTVSGHQRSGSICELVGLLLTAGTHFVLPKHFLLHHVKT